MGFRPLSGRSYRRRSRWFFSRTSSCRGLRSSSVSGSTRNTPDLRRRTSAIRTNRLPHPESFPAGWHVVFATTAMRAAAPTEGWAAIQNRSPLPMNGCAPTALFCVLPAPLDRNAGLTKDLEPVAREPQCFNERTARGRRLTSIGANQIAHAEREMAKGRVRDVGHRSARTAVFATPAMTRRTNARRRRCGSRPSGIPECAVEGRSLSAGSDPSED